MQSHFSSFQGNGDVVSEKVGERDMPPLPEVLYIQRLIRGFEIYGQFDIEQQCQPYGHIRITAEVKIELKSEQSKQKLTYHDSCYLGRYNKIYDSPRNSLMNLSGIDYLEMERNKSKGFCCGAGGGRMFLEDEEGGKINIERTKEAIETGAEKIASACPFCMTMLTDGIKHFEKSEQIEVKDIAEIVLENTN